MNTPEEREQPYRVRAVARRAGALRFGGPQTIDAGGAVDTVEGPLVAELDERGRAFLAWSNVRRAGGDQHIGAHATRAAAGERFPAPVRVARWRGA